MLRIGSVFSGIGGIERGLEDAGVGRTVWQCEKDDYACEVLRKHWPNVPLYRDVCHLARGARAHREQRCDLLVGGPPCQDVSVAGRGAGVSPGTRSGLWWEYARVVSALRPPLVFVENPARSRGRWLPSVTSSLATLGYRWAYVCVRACDLGYHHERDRVFVLAADVDGLRKLQRRGTLAELGRRADYSIAAQGLAANADCDGRQERGGLAIEATSDTAGRRQPPRHDRRPPLPEMVRAVHGLPCRVDRMRCLGNSVIPEQAAEAWRILFQVVMTDSGFRLAGGDIWTQPEQEGMTA